tara:strand:+ start:441 stop:662 length:222 start_codon:yes stop_codon:yes gene_type:complete
MNSSLETASEILTTLVDVFVDYSLVALVSSSVLVDHFLALLVVSISSSSGQFFQSVSELNISDVLLNLFESIG